MGNKIKIVYKNRLPHIAPVGATFFVTFRLADSLPHHIVRKLKTKMDLAIKKLEAEKPKDYKAQIRSQRKLFFKGYDYQLDHGPFGKCHLKKGKIAEIVKKKLHELDGDKYKLIAYCIMPNHVHVLFDTAIQIVDQNGFYLNDVPENYTQLFQIMKQIKGASAILANRQLNKSGTFWQKDSYDHYVRNERELGNIVNYILQNPVKARLAEKWEDYAHTYLADFVQ